MKSTFLALLISSAFSKLQETARGRKADLSQTYSDNENWNTYYPQTDFCIFENRDNSWCLRGLSPVLRAGWEIDQFWGTDTFLGTQQFIEYYRLQYKPYVKTHLLLESVFDIASIVYNELSFEIPRFQLDLFFSMIVTMNAEYCLGIGWNNDEVMVEITSQTELKDCYKKLIDNLCNPSSSWTGTNAKYIDQCDSSTSVFVNLYEYIWYLANDDQILVNTAVPYSKTFCKPIPLISGANAAGHQTFSSHVTQTAYQHLFSYFKQRQTTM